MKIDLSGKVALITGSSRGIGRGCAVEMAAAGADIAINYHSHADDAENVAQEVRAHGQRAVTIGADVGDRTAVDRMIKETVGALGKVDIIVCNAYYSEREPFLDMSIDGMKKTLDVSLWGAFHTAQSGARQMVAQGSGGSLLFISSVMSFMPFSGSLAYSTAKAGMNHMSSIIAAEMLEHRIRVNVIEPGWTDTPGERQFSTEQQIIEGGKSLPWGRMGTIQDLGQAATFLCSDAADYITGANLRVDGGFWLQQASTTSD
jgi:glucose 1-dehydrogenase